MGHLLSYLSFDLLANLIDPSPCNSTQHFEIIRGMDLNNYDYNPEPHESFFDSMRTHLIDFIQTLVVFGAIFTLIYLFVAQFHKVSGNSMLETMHNGDFLITEKISYRLGDPHRGQIVVLKDPMDETKDFIKRIIAIPGDTVKIEEGRVFVNGGALTESYLVPGTQTRGGAFLSDGATVTIPPNRYLVFGDNRNHSSDSREWGPVAKEKLVGRAFFQYWPPQKVGMLTNR